jgi:hypothetical protein
MKGVLTIADEICDEKRASQLQDEQTFGYDDDGYTRKPKNFINALLDPKHDFTEKEIKDEINTLIAAVRKFIFSNYRINRH